MCITDRDYCNGTIGCWSGIIPMEPAVQNQLGAPTGNVNGVIAE